MSRGWIAAIVTIVVVIVVAIVLIVLFVPTSSENTAKAVKMPKDERGVPLFRATVPAKTTNLERMFEDMPDMSFDQLANARAIVFNDVTQEDFEAGLTVEPVTEQANFLRLFWIRQRQILARISTLLRFGIVARTEIVAELRRLIWTLYNDAQRVALLLIRRHGENFGRRFYDLYTRYLRFMILIMILQQCNETARVRRIRADLDIIMADINALLASVGTVQPIGPCLLEMSDRFWASDAAVMMRGVSDEPFEIMTSVLNAEPLPRTPRVSDEPNLSAFTPAEVVARAVANEDTPVRPPMTPHILDM